MPTKLLLAALLLLTLSACAPTTSQWDNLGAQSSGVEDMEM